MAGEGLVGADVSRGWEGGGGRRVGAPVRAAASRCARTLPLHAGGRRAAAVEELAVQWVAVAGAVARDAVARQAKVRLPGAALDGGAAAALHVDMVRPTVLCAEGGGAVGRAAVGGLHVAALRMLAAAIDHVELAGQPVRCAEARPFLLGIAECGDGAAVGPLAAAMHKVHVGRALVSVAIEEHALCRIAKGRPHTAAASEGANFAD